jgi:hypothetical protein
MELTEAEKVRLLQKVDWTDWSHMQTVRFRVGKGATSFLRTVARQLGLEARVSRAGIDVIYVSLEAK